MRLASTLLRPLLTRELGFPQADFSRPLRERAIVPPDSVSWRVFSNPVSLYVGGIAAVLLELGEPRVRAGVWGFSSFPREPKERMRRTGLGAMLTVYAAKSKFEAYVARVNAIHSQIRGLTDAGQPFRADDPELLRWVQATASYSFLEAYCRLVRPLNLAECDRYYEEAAVGASYYGVAEPARSRHAIAALFARTAPTLEQSGVIHEFLRIMRTAAILPRPFRPLQRVATAAAIDIVPSTLRERIGIADRRPLRTGELRLLRTLSNTIQRIHVPASPWALSCARLGLPQDYLQRST